MNVFGTNVDQNDSLLFDEIEHNAQILNLGYSNSGTSVMLANFFRMGQNLHQVDEHEA